MSTYLLFCTAEVSTNTITTLLQTPRHNFFSLVRTPSQTTFDTPCTQPPTVEPPPTGFLHHTSAQIRAYIAANLPTPIPHTNLEPCQYALLDEQSARDNTVVIAHSYSPLLMRDVDEMDEEERAQWEVECDGYDGEDGAGEEAWCEWRVKFGEAYRITTSLSFEEDFTVKLYNENFVAAHTDGEGVFQVEAAFRAFVEESEGA